MAVSMARPCAQSQKTYLDEDLGRLTLPGVTRRTTPSAGRWTLARFVDRPLWLEVGFGGGEHLVHMAARYPQVDDHRLRALRQRHRDAAGQDPAARGATTSACIPAMCAICSTCCRTPA
jgi:hypothetical protein